MDWQEMFEQLHRDSPDLRQIDDNTLAKISALMPRGPTIRTINHQFDKQRYEVEKFRFDWLKSLIKYNETIRKQSPPASAPMSEAESDNEFVPASVILKILSEHFPNHAKLRSYLERRPAVRTRKPSPQRQEIHAREFLVQLAMDFDSGFEFFDEYQKSIERQKEERKSPGRKSINDAK